MNQAHTKHFIGANNIKLIGDVGGDAASPCVVLLHGGGQTRHSWRDAMQNLINRGFHVINMDARGHGDSQWAPDGDYSLDTLARDLSVTVSNSPQRPVIVGASMGGLAALTLLGQKPTAASAWVVVDIVPHVNPAGSQRIESFMGGSLGGFASLEVAAAAVREYHPSRRTGIVFVIIYIMRTSH